MHCISFCSELCSVRIIAFIYSKCNTINTIISSQTKYPIFNTDASEWDSASTTSKASKNLPFYKLEEELASETSVPLPIVREQELHTSAAETQAAANAKNEEGKESSLLGNRPLPSPRSFKSLPSKQHQPQPPTRIQKELFKKAMSDEGKTCPL